MTGGAGFIGSNVVAELVRQGEDVVVLDDLSSGHRENLSGLNVELLEGDIAVPETADRAAYGVDVIFHLAASVGNARSIADPVRDTMTNAVGTLRLLEAARRHAVRKFVYSSSAGIFGELTHPPIHEDHPLNPQTPYGASKLAGEKLALAYSQQFGLEAICLRYFNVFGRNQRYDAYGNVIPIFMKRINDGRPIQIYGDGEQTRDFVNVADVVQANCRAANADGVTGVFNIASATSVTINELAALMLSLAGRDVPIEHVDSRPGDVRHSLADISAARAAFGYTPLVSLQQGLAAYVAWAAT